MFFLRRVFLHHYLVIDFKTDSTWNCSVDCAHGVQYIRDKFCIISYAVTSKRIHRHVSLP